jgi:hypothetical protein
MGGFGASRIGMKQPSWRSAADVVAKWAANAPLAFVDQYIGHLRQYRGIAVDVGDQDGLRTGAAKLHEVLDADGISNTFELLQRRAPHLQSRRTQVELPAQATECDHQDAIGIELDVPRN